ncbi:hypothetical protein ES705_36337 [subsurface metagenome]
MPDMAPDQFAALKEDIKERGVLTPIDIDEDGNLLDGHHRYRACLELGITEYPVTIRPGLSEENKRMFARKSNMMRRHLTRKQIREIVEGQLRETPEWANNRIGRELGVDKNTVKSVREKLESTSEIPKLEKFIGEDGKERRQPIRGIPVATKAEKERILELMKKEGVDISALPTGFVESASVPQIIDPGYDPLYGIDEEEIREWRIFQHFLVECCGYDVMGASGFIEYRRQKDFRTPTEWAEEGMGWLIKCGCSFSDRNVKQWEKTNKAWFRFLEEANDEEEYEWLQPENRVC